MEKRRKQAEEARDEQRVKQELGIDASQTGDFGQPDAAVAPAQNRTVYQNA